MTTTATYDSFGRMVSSTDATGQTTGAAYSPATGFATSVTLTPPIAALQTSYTLDPRFGVVTSMVDAAAPVTSASYDGFGRRLTVDKPGGYVDDINYVYTAASVPGAGNQLYTTAAKVQTRTRASNGLYTSSFTFFDGLGRHRETQTAGNVSNTSMIVNATFYDGNGRVRAQTAPIEVPGGVPGNGMQTLNGSTNSMRTIGTQYDAMSRPIEVWTWSNAVFQFGSSIVYDGGTTTTLSPTPVEPSKSVTDIFGRTTSTIEMIGNVAKTTVFGYTKRDEVATVTDPAGNVTSNSYNMLGWPTSLLDPDLGFSQYGYDNTGRMTTRTDAKGQVLTTVYDTVGRRIQEKQGGTVLASWVFDTVRDGQLSSSEAVCAGCGGTNLTRTEYVYTNRNEVTQVTFRVPDTLGFGNATAGCSVFGYNYSFDNQGWQNVVTYPALPGGVPAETVSTTFDTTLGKPTTLSTNMAGVGTYVTGTGYKGWGGVEWRTLNTASTGAANTVIPGVAYDGLGRLSVLYGFFGSWGSTTPRAQDQSFIYDANQNITQAKDYSGSSSGIFQGECFTYDSRNRLVGAYTGNFGSQETCTAGPSNHGPNPYNETYSYSDIGNITSKTGQGAYTYTGGTNPTGLTADMPRTGTKSLKLTPAAGVSNADSIIPHTLGVPNTFTRWVKGSDVVNPAITYFNSSWVQIGQETLATFTLNGTWQQLVTTYTLPAGTAFVWQGVWSTDPNPWYIDDVTVTTGGSSSPTTITAPTGWNPVTTNTTTGVTLATWQRTATAGDPTSWTFTLSQTAKATGTISGYSGVNTSPIDVAATSVNASTTNHVAPSITTTGINRKIVTVNAVAAVTTMTPPAGSTERADQAGGAGAPTVSIETSEFTQTAAGATGTKTSVSSTAGVSVTATVGLRPTTTGAGTPTWVKYYAIAGVPIAMRTGTGLSWLIRNQQGTVVATVADGTTTVTRNRYLPYGTIRGTDQTATDRGWIGQTEDPAIGLSYLNARYQDPQLGVFISVDPLVAATRQAYVYGNMSPVAFSDPSGLEPCAWCSSGGEQQAQQEISQLSSAELWDRWDRWHNTGRYMIGEHTNYDTVVKQLLNTRTGHDDGGVTPGAELLVEGYTTMAGNGIGKAIGKGVGKAARLLGKLIRGGDDAAKATTNTASGAADDALAYATRAEKLDHIFVDKHNLGPLVEQFGSREAVAQQMLNSVKGLTPASGTFEIPVTIGGQTVVVRGAVVNGVTKLGTAFTP